MNKRIGLAVILALLTPYFPSWLFKIAWFIITIIGSALLTKPFSKTKRTSLMMTKMMIDSIWICSKYKTAVVTFDVLQLPCLHFLHWVKLSAVRLFSGAFFILSEFTDISFEVKAVLCFDFYAFGDVFLKNGIVQQDCIVSNRFELERNILKIKKHSLRKTFFLICQLAFSDI